MFYCKEIVDFFLYFSLFFDINVPFALFFVKNELKLRLLFNEAI